MPAHAPAVDRQADAAMYEAAGAARKAIAAAISLGIGDAPFGGFRVPRSASDFVRARAGAARVRPRGHAAAVVAVAPAARC
jgi:hypothetical protein